MFNIITFCVFAFLIENIACQCLRSPLSTGILGAGIMDPLTYGNVLTYGADAYANPWLDTGYGLNLATLSSNRCGFTVTSSSPIAPNGVSILSENMVIEGPLAVNGQLPFLSTVGVEGNLPASGVGVVAYGCGNGNVGITNEAMPGAGYPVPGQYGRMPMPVSGINAVYGGCPGIY